MMAEARDDTVIPEDLITCPICFEVFKSPKYLPCLHTFCKGCLHAYFSKTVEENKTKVACPVCCTHVTDVTEQDIDQCLENLPTNFMVKSLIERDKVGTGKKNCEVCEHSGKSTPATTWCQECSEGYCDKCSDELQAYKALRKHKLIPIKEASRFGKFSADECARDCSVHKNRKIELFCNDHEQLCCLTCMTVDHRKCNKVTTLEEASDNFRNNPTFLAFTNRMTELVTEMKEQSQTDEKMKKEFQTQLLEVRNQALQTKEGVLKQMGVLYMKFEDDIGAIEKTHEADDQSDVLKQKMMQLQLFVSTLNTLKSITSNITIFLEYHKIKEKEKVYREFIDDYRSNSKPVSLDFKCHENLRNFESAVSSLGEIRVINSFARAQASFSIDYTTCRLIEVVTIEKNGVRFTDAVYTCSDTILAVSDKTDAIWAYDNKGTILSKSDLPCKPWGLTIVGTSQVVVSLRERKSIQFITYVEHSATFVKGKTISLEEEPFAVDYADNHLFVTFAHNIKRLKLDGTLVTELNIPGSSAYLYGISCCDSSVIVGDHCYLVSNSHIHVISTESYQHVNYQKKYAQLNGPVGVATDRDGNIYVAGWLSNNVIQLSPNGDLIREILPSTRGIQSPDGINISDNGRRLILTHGSKITVFEFL